MSDLQVLVLASSVEEIRPFLRVCWHRRLAADRCRGWRFAGPGFQGTAVLLGMGGPGVATLAGRAMARYRPQVVVSLGFGGALTAVPPAAGMVVARSCRRLLSVELPLEDQPFLPAVPSVPALVQHLQSQGLPIHEGTVITLPRITPKAAILPLATGLAAPVVDLETAAVAAAAASQGLPLLALRAVTDAGGEEIQPFLARLINRYHAVPPGRLPSALAADPRRLGYLLHLWGRSRRAGRHLASALQQSLAYLACLYGGKRTDG